MRMKIGGEPRVKPLSISAPELVRTYLFSSNYWTDVEQQDVTPVTALAARAKVALVRERIEPPKVDKVEKPDKDGDAPQKEA